MLKPENVPTNADEKVAQTQGEANPVKTASLDLGKPDASAETEQETLTPDAFRAMLGQPIVAPPAVPAKEQVTIWLDRDLLTRLRATGPGWENRISETLNAVLG